MKFKKIYLDINIVLTFGVEYSLVVAKKGDFVIDDTYTFEIGGKNKKFKQIKDLPNSYVVSDDIEIGNSNKIPLWLFGFIY